MEAVDAIKQGATEIDMVIDISKAKEHDYHAVAKDIQMVREATEGYILKVIIETALLTDDEKKAMCEAVNKSGADYIKTSTGFASDGATFVDVALLRKYSAPHVKIKAAGGITTLDDAIKFIEFGAERLGTSRIVKIIQGMASSNSY
jgi:deoxyribose-phosphate aldolase